MHTVFPWGLTSMFIGAVLVALGLPLAAAAQHPAPGESTAGPAVADIAPGPPDQQPAPHTAAPSTPADRPWLGVRLIPVPQALSAHLRSVEQAQVFGNGVMVDNVALSSPAAEAGLKRYDVIVAMNHQPVQADLRQFVRQLAACKPGQNVPLVIVRNGRTERLSVKLAHALPTESVSYRYQYPTQPRQLWTDQVDFRGGVLRRTAEGWAWQRFDRNDLTLVNELPPDIARHVRQWTQSGLGENFSQIRVESDGWVTQLQRDATGRLVVTRSAQDTAGETLIRRTYASIEDLARDDPASYRLLESVLGAGAGTTGRAMPPLATIGADGGTPQIGQPRTGGKRGSNPTGDPAASVDQPMPGDSGASNDPSQADASDDEYRHLMEQYDQYLQQRQAQGERQPRSSRQADPIPAEALEIFDDRAESIAGPPARQFTISPTGHITVRVRSGEGELLMQFDSEQELAQRQPQLYQHYRGLTRSLD